MVSTGWTKINLDSNISQSVRKGGGEKEKPVKQKKTATKTKEAENRK
jgi:hypothetical protein